MADDYDPQEVEREYRLAVRMLAAVVLLVLACVVASLFTGCAAWQFRTETVEEERRVGTDAGKPTDLTIRRRAREDTQGKSGPDQEALAAMLAAVVRQAVPGLDAITGAVRAAVPPPAPALDLAPLTARLDEMRAATSKPQPAPGVSAIDGVLGTGATAAGIGLIVKHLEAKRLRKAKAEAYAKVDEHQRKLVDLARELPPTGKGA